MKASRGENGENDRVFFFVSWSLFVSQALFLLPALCREKT